MKAKEFAEELLKHPELEVLFGDDEYDYYFGKPVLARIDLTPSGPDKINKKTRVGPHTMSYRENEGTQVWILDQEDL
jgi:hypothetical protein